MRAQGEDLARAVFDHSYYRHAGPTALAGIGASVELFGKADNDALWPADVGQTVCVLVLHLTNELSPVFEHVRNDSVNVIDGEHDAT